MELTGSINQNPKRKGIDGNLKQNPTNNGSINKLPDDLLINILSRLSLKEAARTSVLERRWRSLWCFVFGILQFDYRTPIPARIFDAGLLSYDAWEKFEGWVSSVLELHQGGHIEGLVIRFYGLSRRKSDALDSWVYFAVLKEVERFELHLYSCYCFPSLEMLVSHSHSGSPFCCLRTLRLVGFSVKDEVVNYFLASCPNLEELSLVRCTDTKNVLVVDPPSLRVLKISRCYELQSLEVSAASLVSLAYGGSIDMKSVVFKKIPNIRELTIVDDLLLSLLYKTKKHSSYVHVDQLVKLVVDNLRDKYEPPFARDLPQLCCLKRLEVKILTSVAQSLLFFASFIKASPQLCEFRIEMKYQRYSFNERRIREGARFEHRGLKVFEMVGYIGCSSEEELVRALVKNAPLIEKVVIDTESKYYEHDNVALVVQVDPRDDRMDTGASTRTESQHHAQNLVSTLPQRIHFIIT